MTYLLDEREAQIAAWINKILKTLAEIRTTAGPNNEFGLKWWTAFAGVGWEAQVKALGPEAGRDVQAIEKLKADGKISAAEAIAFLTAKYPDQDWASGKWGDKLKENEDSQVRREDEKPDLDPTKKSRFEQAMDAQGAELPRFGSPGAASGLPVDELPLVWDADAAQQALESFAGSVSGRLAGIEQGRITFPAHTLDGGALIPGSVPYSALDPVGIRERLSTFPKEDQAIGLLISHSDTMDRPYTGPGRVWRVNRAVFPRGWTPAPGPLRYRVIVPGMRFGVMNLELADPISPNPQMIVGYGLVLQGIPSFGRRMRRIASIQWVEDAPQSFASENVATGGSPDGPFRMLEARAKAEYDDASPAFMSNIGSGTALDPTGAEIAKSPGFSFGLVVGETDTEVFRQVNTRKTAFGRVWHADGVLSGLSLPHSAGVRPPFPGQAIQWDGEVDVSAGYVGLQASANIGSEGRLIEGIPMHYRDCERLRATEQVFSVVIQPLATHTESHSLNDTWPSVSGWPNHGMQTVLADTRFWAIDIIVE